MSRWPSASGHAELQSGMLEFGYRLMGPVVSDAKIGQMHVALAARPDRWPGFLKGCPCSIPAVELAETDPRNRWLTARPGAAHGRARSIPELPRNPVLKPADTRSLERGFKAIIEFQSRVKSAAASAGCMRAMCK